MYTVCKHVSIHFGFNVYCDVYTVYMYGKFPILLVLNYYELVCLMLAKY